VSHVGAEAAAQVLRDPRLNLDLDAGLFEDLAAHGLLAWLTWVRVTAWKLPAVKFAAHCEQYALLAYDDGLVEHQRLWLAQRRHQAPPRDAEPAEHLSRRSW
jgi:hypothetical protein